MKTSVKNIMMSMALMGCLTFSASDAFAQGRIQSQGGSATSRKQSATVSSRDESTATQVTRPSVPSGNASNANTSQVNRNNNSSTGTNTVGNRNDNLATTVTGSSESTGRKGDATTRPATTTQGGSGNSGKPDNGDKPGNGGNSDKPGNSGNPGMPTGGGYPSMPPSTGGGDPGMPSHPDEGGPSTPPHPDEGGPSTPPHPGDGCPGEHPAVPVEVCPCVPLIPSSFDRIGYGPEHPYDYSFHYYCSEFIWNYENHNWSTPLTPAARVDRPSFRGWSRPVIPAGWHYNNGAPVIDGILGIPFGTSYDDALDYLFFNGYLIDGYANSIIYLRSVPLLNIAWSDVMLALNSQGKLVNAEFIHKTTYCAHHHNTTCRCKDVHNRINSYFYKKVYRALSEIFGTPIYNSSGSLSWYGGHNVGWVTLLTYTNSGNYYIMLSIGN